MWIIQLAFALDSGPTDATARVLLAHGAGVGISSPFLESLANCLAERAIATTRFEFAYMTARRTGKSKRPPPRAQALTQEFRDMVHNTARASTRRSGRLFVGGKSLGGRVASLVADELYDQGEIAGLICLGYPFHPPKKPDELRTEHLQSLDCPALIVQGERDPFGCRDEVEPLRLSKQIEFCWIADGDHDFGPRGRSGFTRNGNLATAADAVAAFVSRLESAR